MTTSYVQTRGSVPVFWEQPGLQVCLSNVHDSFLTSLLRKQKLVFLILGSSKHQLWFRHISAQKIISLITAELFLILCMQFYCHGCFDFCVIQFSNFIKSSVREATKDGTV